MPRTTMYLLIWWNLFMSPLRAEVKDILVKLKYSAIDTLK